jgi:muconolactone delta-isomerase
MCFDDEGRLKEILSKMRNDPWRDVEAVNLTSSACQKKIMMGANAGLLTFAARLEIDA